MLTETPQQKQYMHNKPAPSRQRKENCLRQLVQLKANRAANASYYILMLLIAAADAVLLFTEIQATLTLNRVFTYVILFIGLRNAIEMFALKYFDQQM